MENKKQHWISQSYLEAWWDPDVPEGYDNYVWVYSSDGNIVKNKSPKNIFYELDMYTIHLTDGTRVLDIEHGLSGLEGAFVEVRENVITKRKDLSLENRIIVLAFMAASFSRTRLQRDHVKGQWREALDLMEEMDRFVEQATSEQLENLAALHVPSDGPKLSMSEVKRLAENPLQETLISYIVTQTELFFPMNLRILCTENDPGFITSDAPCVWYDPEAYNRSAFYRSPGLMFPKIEITLPISPGYMAFLTWSTKINTYIDVPDRVVDELNRRTRFFAEQYFVVRRQITKPIWFDPGKPPSQR